MTFTLVVAESDILPIDVPVASLQLSDQLAFGYLSAPQQTVWTDIVGKRGKEQLSKPKYYPNLAFYHTEYQRIVVFWW